MPLTQEWYQKAQEVLGRKGVFTFNGRTAWDQAGLDIIVAAEGGLEGDAEGTIVGGHGAEMFIPRIEVSGEDLSTQIGALLLDRKSLETEKAQLATEREALNKDLADLKVRESSLEADREALKTERLAFESLKAAWVGQKSKEPVSLRVIFSQDELEGMEHGELGRLCSVWEVPVPAKKADRIAAIHEAQEKHQSREGDQKEGDSSGGA